MSEGDKDLMIDQSYVLPNLISCSDVSGWDKEIDVTNISISGLEELQGTFLPRLETDLEDVNQLLIQQSE